MLPVLKRMAPVLSLAPALVLAACATTSRPCSGGGDVSWVSSRYPGGSIPGDKHCIQKPLSDGRYVNHGAFSVTFANGKLALEGRFEEGRKEGVWSEYDEAGNKVAERYFEKGVEKAAPSSASTK